MDAAQFFAFPERAVLALLASLLQRQEHHTQRMERLVSENTEQVTELRTAVANIETAVGGITAKLTDVAEHVSTAIANLRQQAPTNTDLHPEIARLEAAAAALGHIGDGLSAIDGVVGVVKAAPAPEVVPVPTAPVAGAENPAALAGGEAPASVTAGLPAVGEAPAGIVAPETQARVDASLATGHVEG